MKPSEFVMKELEGEGILHCEVRYYSKNPVKYEKKSLIHIEDILQARSKINNTYISVEEHEKEIKGLKTRQINFHCDYSALKVEIKKLKQQLSKTIEIKEVEKIIDECDTYNILKDDDGILKKELKQKLTKEKG